MNHLKTKAATKAAGSPPKAQRRHKRCLASLALTQHGRCSSLTHSLTHSLIEDDCWSGNIPTPQQMPPPRSTHASKKKTNHAMVLQLTPLVIGSEFSSQWTKCPLTTLFFFISIQSASFSCPLGLSTCEAVGGRFFFFVSDASRNSAGRARERIVAAVALIYSRRPSLRLRPRLARVTVEAWQYEVANPSKNQTLLHVKVDTSTGEHIGIASSKR